MWFGKALLGAVVLGGLADVGFGQTIYSGVRFQYGQYNEINYGGVNPTITSNQIGYMPEQLRSAYNVRRRAATMYPYPSPYTPGGAGTTFVSPYTQSMTITYGTNQPLVFSDAFPGEEVGQFGFTIDMARNEAYSNVPRIQAGGQVRPVVNAGPVVVEEKKVVATPKPTERQLKMRAIPLLNWARAERAKNVPLYQALLKEARKYDAEAVEALEKEPAPAAPPAPNPPV
jgi:hypothetical protein